MKEYLLSLGFKYIGRCNCNGGNTEAYENGNVRVDITNQAYVIKKKSPIHFQTVSYGNESRLKEDLPKWL